MERSALMDRLRQVTQALLQDLAGRGHTPVDQPARSQPQFTSNEHFSRDSAGTLLDKQGHAVLDVNGNPIVIAVNEPDFSVAPDGTVSTKNLGVVAKIRPVRLDVPLKRSLISAGLYQLHEDARDHSALQSDLQTLGEYISQQKWDDIRLAMDGSRSAIPSNFVMDHVGRVMKVPTL